ncbi:hypothetical protein UCMB321_3391 [Pseudomonas batumici]|uniref:Uncharacterized protein n=1 Tax=Pseudomonas batumici TaxID=226910 RepID=A0A0C2I0U5_9PSED|nr:hypothetical protein UCMB321_3391 [Pseudomonas batumici]
MLRQRDARAALMGKQQLTSLMLMEAGVVIAQGGGNANDRRRVVVGVESCMGVEPGHRLSDFKD